MVFEMPEPGLTTAKADVPWASLGARPIDVVTQEPEGPSGTGRLIDILGELGCRAQPVAQTDFELSPERIVWIRGNAIWHPIAVRRLAAAPPGERPRVVLWHSEPLPFPREAGLRLERPHARELGKILLRHHVTDPHSNARQLRRLARDRIVDLLAVSTQGGQAFLAEQGIRAEFVPLGYHPTHGRDLGLARDIDVLFLGALTVPRRTRVLERLEREGIRIHAVGSWDDQRYWGESRTRLINRAKIMLNLPRHSGLLSGMRMILGMANKALVVCEPVYLPDPYLPGEHYASASVDEMPAVIRHYLKHEEERTRMTERAYRFVIEELTMAHSVGTILSLAAERLAPPDP